ncbi:hypothetical protein B0H19DRAFT_1371023 [Mycena capillaripes]|nr:hypothetical protein B0H19DRAFT_1371023 [Mycena capillaripes]
MPIHVSFFIAGLLAIGSCMSLLTKYQDMQCVEKCDDPDPNNHVLYEQPVIQTLFMFSGEIICIIPVASRLFLRKLATPAIQLPVQSDAATEGSSKKASIKGYQVLAFWLPAIFDLFATTLMNTGIMLTPISIFQMTRGSLILFTGLFGVLLLNRKLRLYQWTSLFIVATGVALVALSTHLRSSVNLTGPEATPEYREKFIGVIFILLAQLFSALQFTVEEKLMEVYDVNTSVVVALEGIFGLTTTAACIPVAHLIFNSRYLDLTSGWNQTVQNTRILVAGIFLSITIAFFNYFGLSITLRLGATSRTLTDACRALLLWGTSLLLGWEFLSWTSSPLQIAGYMLLLYGTLLYGGLIPVPFRREALREDGNIVVDH